MNWYSIHLTEALSGLSSDRVKGLSAEEAGRRLESSGKNLISGKKGKSIIQKFGEQFSDFLIMILLAAAVISFAVSYLSGSGDFVDAILIMAIVFINAVMGVVQETKAERAIESLQKMSVPKTRVIRNGESMEISSEDVVPGDVAVFETGDRITADGRILDCSGLRTEESSLTGESLPVFKSSDALPSESAPLGERFNMVYSGSTVVGGRCRVLVTDTGMNTEVGKIAGLLDAAETPETPLQKRLDNTGRMLGIAALAICGLIFILGIIQNANILDSFMLAVSLAVAAVPEGLPAIVTIVLALGVQRMVKKNAVVRKLPAVETLGSATVICSDKTGTLTQNKMTVLEYSGGSGKEISPKSKARILTYGALCTNCEINSIDGTVQGDPTENAIVIAAQSAGLSKTEAQQRLPRIHEIPFDSRRKLMTTVHTLPDKSVLVITKGAPEVLLSKCSRIDLDGEFELTNEIRDDILQSNSAMAAKALRVIALAYKRREHMDTKGDDLEKDLTFLGLMGMIDPPRPEVREAVATCRRAGIKPVMITGDHAETASAIARELGILRGRSLVITGRELDEISDEQLRRSISKYGVFARVSPEHKSRIVRAYQENGDIVAMTGDGVNDAPALKTADIGCAMGFTGTDVARDASDMVLMDDNFSTIVAAVKEGRGIYQNICRTVHFLISCNIGEILTILVSFLLGRQSPLMPIQLLWVNLVTDSLPALALGSETADADIMERKPVNPKSGMFSGGRAFDIFIQGIMVGALALIAYELGIHTGSHALGSTYAFAVLSLSQLFHAFNVRSDQSLFKIGFFSNKKMTASFIICFLMQCAVICVPSLSAIFGTAALSFSQWRTVILLSIVPLIAVEASKLLSNERFGIFGFYKRAGNTEREN